MQIRADQIKNLPVVGFPVTLRVTTTPFTLPINIEVVFINPDVGGVDMVLNLPPGIQGKHFRLIHTGNFKKKIEVFPNGSEKLFGENKEKLKRGEAFDIHFDPIDGWW